MGNERPARPQARHLGPWLFPWVRVSRGHGAEWCPDLVYVCHGGSSRRMSALSLTSVLCGGHCDFSSFSGQRKLRFMGMVSFGQSHSVGEWQFLDLSPKLVAFTAGSFCPWPRSTLAV